jgi:hypothetical protein
MGKTKLEDNERLAMLSRVRGAAIHEYCSGLRLTATASGIWKRIQTLHWREPHMAIVSR